MIDDVVTAVSALLLAIALLGMVARTVESRRQSLIVVAALAPWLMAAAAPAALLADVAGRWLLCAGGVVVFVLGAATQWPLFRRRREQQPSGTPLNVMQANILVGGADPDALAALVDRLDVEVLTVCEVTGQGLDRIMASDLPRLLPYCHCSTGEMGDGTGIWSRYPLSDPERHDGFVTELLSARVEVPDGPSPLVFAVHPVPPWPRKPGDWLRELELLRQMLAKIPTDMGPVIVAGDFNATADHRRYRCLLDEGYHDAAQSAGAGYLPTYPADRRYPPVIAIDHILLRDATARSVDTIELPGSDHRGIWARITL